MSDENASIMQYIKQNCLRCSGGMVHVGSPTEVKLAFCTSCNGTGRTLSLLYPRPSGCRGNWPPTEQISENAEKQMPNERNAHDE